MPGSPDRLRATKCRKEKAKAKEKVKADSRRTGRAFFGEEQAQDPEWWSEEDFSWWSKGKKGKKGFSEGNDGFQKGGFRTYQPGKRRRQGFLPKTEAEERTKKERAGNVLIPNLEYQPLKHPVKKDMAMPGNQMTGLPAMGLTIPRPQLPGGLARRLTLHGW